MNGLTLVVVAAIMVTSAVGDGDALAVFATNLAVGAGAAFRANGFAIFFAQGDGATRTLTIVDACFVDFARWT